MAKRFGPLMTLRDLVRMLITNHDDLVQRLDDIHGHVQALDSGLAQLDEMLKRIVAIQAQEKALAAAVKKLGTTPSGGLSAADTAEVIAAFRAVAVRLSAVANDPDNPDPEAAVTSRRTRRPVMAKAELLALAATFDEITNNIAGDILRLKAKIVPGMSDADVAEVQAAFEGVASRLQAVANDPDNPDPIGPPDPPVEPPV